jgi:hypothetical protein
MPGSPASAGGLDDLDALEGLDALGDLDALAGLEGIGADAGAADPTTGIDYDNLTNEEATKAEVSEVLAAFKARAQAEQDRFALVTDSEYWVGVCFQTREQKEAFLAGAKLLQHGDKYIDGRLLAKRMGIELPGAAVPYNPSPKVDAKFAALVKDL